MHGESWEKQKQHGRGREQSSEQLWTKWPAKKEQAEEQEQGNQRFNVVKGAGSAARRATLQLSPQS